MLEKEKNNIHLTFLGYTFLTKEQTTRIKSHRHILILYCKKNRNISYSAYLILYIFDFESYKFSTKHQNSSTKNQHNPINKCIFLRSGWILFEIIHSQHI